jgi:hypothetical protein
VLEATAKTNPRLVLVLKTNADRIRMTAEYAHEVMAAMGSLEPLCYVQRDYIREVFVGEGCLIPPYRGWSLSRSEETKHPGQGLRYATRSRTLISGGGPDVDYPRLPRGPLRPRPPK